MHQSRIMGLFCIGERVHSIGKDRHYKIVDLEQNCLILGTETIYTRHRAGRVWAHGIAAQRREMPINSWRSRRINFHNKPESSEAGTSTDNPDGNKLYPWTVPRPRQKLPHDSVLRWWVYLRAGCGERHLGGLREDKNEDPGKGEGKGMWYSEPRNRMVAQTRRAICG